jgi:hypothetical protein
MLVEVQGSKREKEKKIVKIAKLFVLQKIALSCAECLVASIFVGLIQIIARISCNSSRENSN